MQCHPPPFPTFSQELSCLLLVVRMSLSEALWAQSCLFVLRLFMDLSYLPYSGVRDRNWETCLLTMWSWARNISFFHILICKMGALNPPSEIL